ncbi:UNVERIFIED_CONTAM: hypothetical protein HDU68_004124 [Siphonaria sp. JEL0065]|nr:hypothetical protein HDU68_004124 [Siphonaria sp. JEL0065]
MAVKRKANESDIAQPVKKRLPPPTLPAGLQNKYKAKIESKLSANAGGKTVEFVPGNWSTIVYISVIPSDEMRKVIDSAMAKGRDVFPGIIPVVAMDDGGLHISLSRTVFLKAFQIPRFIDLLKAKFSVRKR